MNRLTRLASAVALTFTVSSCSDGTSPGDLNPVALQNRLENLLSAFETNAAFNSMLTLSSFFPCYNPSCPPPLMEAALMPRRFLLASQAGSLGDRVTAMRRFAPAWREMSSLSDIQALFPANVLGKTLEWSTQAGEYVIGSGTGAPANGVRILMYVVDPAGTGPVIPLQQLGYADFTDLSTPQYNRLGVLLRLGGATIADYHITLTTTTTLSTLRAVGRLNEVDLAGHADFDISATGDTVNLFELSQDITGSDGTGLHVLFGGDNTSSDFEVGIAGDGNELEMNIHEEGDVLSGEVLYNGTTVATVSGDASGAPVFLGLDGDPLPADQVEALGTIFIMATVFALILTFGILGPSILVF